MREPGKRERHLKKAAASLGCPRTVRKLEQELGLHIPLSTVGQSENASPFQLTECKNFLDPAGAKHYGGGINYHGGTRKAWANKADRQLGDRVCTLGSTTGGGGRSTCHENSLGIL